MVGPTAEISLAPLETTLGGESAPDELRRSSSILFAALKKCTGQDVGTLEVDCQNRRVLDAAGAVAYGLVDQIDDADDVDATGRPVVLGA